MVSIDVLRALFKDPSLCTPRMMIERQQTLPPPTAHEAHKRATLVTVNKQLHADRTKLKFNLQPGLRSIAATILRHLSPRFFIAHRVAHNDDAQSLI